jgi:hypothetical protein
MVNTVLLVARRIKNIDLFCQYKNNLYLNYSVNSTVLLKTTLVSMIYYIAITAWRHAFHATILLWRGSFCFSRDHKSSEGIYWIVRPDLLHNSP